jgi:oxygen-independent coproporphyrinogen III oxidase
MNEPKPPGLYVHVPFCLSKCPYCDFYSVTAVDLIPAWLQAFEEECRLQSGSFIRPFDSLFVGGGTPSILSIGQLDRLMASIHRHFTLEDGSEISIEVNPDDVTRESLGLFHNLGFNRISLGVQSIHDEELRFLGRRHTACQTLKALDRVRSSGFDLTSIDLIYGLSCVDGTPQRPRWESTLRSVLHFNPDHISCYMMTIEGKTRFRRLHAEGKLKTPSDRDLEELYLLTSEFLEARGFVHYEISNFARSLQTSCRHNSKYWDHSPYLGLGPSAHSFQDGKRWWNLRSVRRYCEALRQGHLPIEASEELTEEQLYLETLFLGFRTLGGVERSLVLKNSNSSEVLDELIRSGILEMREHRVIPTRKGFLLADGLPLLF